MKTKHLTLLLFICCVFSIKASAQETISLEETLKFINNKFHGKVVVDLKDGDIISKFYNKQHQVFRIDKADTEHLDYKAFHFDENENMLLLPCYSTDGECVERKFPLKKEGAMAQRASYVLENPADANALIKAFTHLIRTVEDITYKSLEKFE